MNRLGAFARVPFLDGPIVLQAGVAAQPGAFGDFAQQRGGVFLFQRLARGDGPRPPFLALQRGAHEVVAGAHGKVFILVHDAAVGLAVVGAVVALLNERPGLLLLPHFGLDELLDVAVPIAQGVHFSGAPGLAAAFDHVGNLIIDFEERQGAAGPTATAELFLARTQGREVGAGTRAELEEHGLAVRQAHDRLHIVVHRLDEAGAALRIDVLGFGTLCLAGLAIVKPVASAGMVADGILMIKADVKPNR